MNMTRFILGYCKSCDEAVFPMHQSIHPSNNSQSLLILRLVPRSWIASQLSLAQSGVLRGHVCFLNETLKSLRISIFLAEFR